MVEVKNIDTLRKRIEDLIPGEVTFKVRVSDSIQSERNTYFIDMDIETIITIISDYGAIYDDGTSTFLKENGYKKCLAFILKKAYTIYLEDGSAVDIERLYVLGDYVKDEFYKLQEFVYKCCIVLKNEYVSEEGKRKGTASLPIEYFHVGVTAGYSEDAFNLLNEKCEELNRSFKFSNITSDYDIEFRCFPELLEETGFIPIKELTLKKLNDNKTWQEINNIFRYSARD